MSDWNSLNLDEDGIVMFYEDSMNGLDAIRPELYHLGENGLVGIDSISRWVHSVEGNSEFFNLEEPRIFAKKLENFLQKVKSGKLEHDSEIIALIIKGVILLRDLLKGLITHKIKFSTRHNDYMRTLEVMEYRYDDENIDELIKVTEDLRKAGILLAEKGLVNKIREIADSLNNILSSTEEEEQLNTHLLITEKAVLLKSVITFHEEDITKEVRYVLRMLEELNSLGKNATCLHSSLFSKELKKIYNAIYPNNNDVDQTFDWKQVLSGVSTLPVMLENFWKNFWRSGLEMNSQITYHDLDEWLYSISSQSNLIEETLVKASVVEEVEIGKRILLLHCSEIIRNYHRYILEKLGYEVIIPDTALEEWEQIFDQPLNLILTDLGNIPTIDPATLVNRILQKARQDQIPILIATDREDLQKYGSEKNIHIINPADPESLVENANFLLNSP